MKNKVVILCPLVLDYALRYIDAALALDLQPLFVLTSGAAFDSDTLLGAEVLRIETLSNQPDELLKQLRQDNAICGIVAGGEFSVEAADYLALRLNLTRSMNGAADVLRNKHTMRQAFDQAGVNQPTLFGIAHSQDEARLLADLVQQYPIISKPVDMAGSWYVALNQDQAELLKNVEPIFSYRQSLATGIKFVGACLFEEFFLGDEYSAEVVVENGQLVEMYVNRKFLSATPAFDEIAHLCGVVLPPTLQEALTENVRRIILAAQVQSSILHVEFKRNNMDQLAIIEVGCRIAGDYISSLMELTHGVSLEKIMVALKTGLPLPCQRVQLVMQHGIRFLFEQELPPQRDSSNIVTVAQKLYMPPTKINTKLSSSHLWNRSGYEIVKVSSEKHFAALIAP